MAKPKKSSTLEMDLANADYMTILAGGGTSKVFSKNQLVDYSYPTGIAIFDYAFGYEVIVRDENDVIVKKRTCLGLQAGSFNVLTGRTQSFKTTIACQMIANIAFANGGNIVHYDAEQRLVLQRVKTLTKLPESWFTGEYPRYSLRSGAIGFDTLQNDIAEIYENKMRHKDLLLKDTGEVDDHNQPIMLMPPTVVFLDSLQDVINKEYDINDKKWVDESKELRGNMYGAQSAKTIRGLLTDILPMLKEANIILIAIAHKTSNMSLNPFAGVKKQFQYGSNDERISGGSAVEFNASAVINLSGIVKEDSRYHENTDGFEGNTVLFEPTKSSTNESGNEKTGLGFNIVVDKRKEGVDNIRTLILFLNQRGRLKGNKAGYRVVDKNGEIASEKFTWKNVYEDFKTDPVTYKSFMLAAKEELETLISKAEDTAGQIKPFSIENELNNL
jgi:hypothetical protein